LCPVSNSHVGVEDKGNGGPVGGELRAHCALGATISTIGDALNLDLEESESDLFKYCSVDLLFLGEGEFQRSCRERGCNQGRKPRGERKPGATSY
jgi:hypothetical protein